MYVARKDRTNASALFVSLSAVGMALGPLLALPLSHITAFKLFGMSSSSSHIRSFMASLGCRTFHFGHAIIICIGLPYHILLSRLNDDVQGFSLFFLHDNPLSLLILVTL